MTERWIGTKEIREALSCGKTYANQLIHMFEARNQAYDLNKGGKPMLRVKERVFNDWLNHECKIEIRGFGR